MADAEKFMKGPERNAVDEANRRWGRATDAWAAAGRPEHGPEVAEMTAAYEAMTGAFDALHIAAFGVPFPRDAA